MASQCLEFMHCRNPKAKSRSCFSEAILVLVSNNVVCFKNPQTQQLFLSSILCILMFSNNKRYASFKASFNSLNCRINSMIRSSGQFCVTVEMLVDMKL